MSSYEQVLEIFKQQEETISAQDERLFHLEENLARRVLDLDDLGWTRIDGRTDDSNGIPLDKLHNITEKLQDMAAMHPLSKRGAQLRHAYVFGRGVNFEGLQPKTEALINNVYNQAALFSVQAHESNNLALFTDGNLFVIRNKDNILTTVPINQIQGVITDPEDASKIRYFKRVWSIPGTNGQAERKEKWYPLARYKNTIVGRGKRNGGLPKSFLGDGGKRIPVEQDSVMYFHSTQRQVGWTFGVPDSLAGSVWIQSYSKYLANNSALNEALTQIAWQIQSATKRGSGNAGAAISQAGGPGGTAITGMGNMLSSVGVPSAQVNFNNGQPLAALVAASFGVPVIALLSSPGATGGSYGAAQTLSDPSIKGFQAVQDSWTVFYLEILSDMGSPNAEVSFPSLEQDPTYREVQSIVVSTEAGLVHQDEARAKVLDLLDIKSLHESLPELNPNFKAPAQGVSGTVPGGFDQDTSHED